MTNPIIVYEKFIVFFVVIIATTCKCAKIPPQGEMDFYSMGEEVPLVPDLVPLENNQNDDIDYEAGSIRKGKGQRHQQAKDSNLAKYEPYNIKDKLDMSQETEHFRKYLRFFSEVLLNYSVATTIAPAMINEQQCFYFVDLVLFSPQIRPFL